MKANGEHCGPTIDTQKSGPSLFDIHTKRPFLTVNLYTTYYYYYMFQRMRRNKKKRFNSRFMFVAFCVVFLELSILSISLVGFFFIFGVILIVCFPSSLHS